MKTEIICVGTELLVGDIVNTNAQYISAKFTNIGIDLYYQTTVGDNYGRLKGCLENAFKRVDLVITTGGLGPTVDDITKEVVADYFGEELEVIERYYDLIVKRYNERGFGEVASGGRKEASILRNSKLLENEVGLAPGFFYEKDNKKIIVLPGPPREMTWMVDNQVLPLLKQYSNDVLLMRTLEIRGIPEGRIDDRLKNYFEMSNPTVAPYAKEGCVHVRIAMKGDRGSSDYLIAEIDKIADEIFEFGDLYFYGLNIKDNIEIVKQKMNKLNVDYEDDFFSYHSTSVNLDDFIYALKTKKKSDWVACCGNKIVLLDVHTDEEDSYILMQYFKRKYPLISADDPFYYCCGTMMGPYIFILRRLEGYDSDRNEKDYLFSLNLVNAGIFNYGGSLR